MRKLILAIMLASVSNVLASGGLLDLKGILQDTRVGMFFDQHRQDHVGVYSPLLSYKSKSGINYANLNVGYLENIDSGDGSPLLR